MGYTVIHDYGGRAVASTQKLTIVHYFCLGSFNLHFVSCCVMVYSSTQCFLHEALTINLCKKGLSDLKY